VHKLNTALSVVFTLAAVFLIYSAGYGGKHEVDSPTVTIIEVEGSINPASSAFISKGIKQAEKNNSNFIILRLDTPGGLVSSMKDIVKDIMNSPLPVVIYVGPRGAGAVSAGVFIAISGHIAAMAPGTNIGAAHPVGQDGKDIDGAMSEKITNDMVSYGRGIAKNKNRNPHWVERSIRESASITSEEAFKLGVIDMLADDMDSLIEQLDGMEVPVNGQTVKLSSRGLKKVYINYGLRDNILRIIGDPNIAYILLMIGMIGLYFEFVNPGAIFPGVTGGICLILAFYSMQTLPVSYAGVLLIFLSIVFFIAEVFTASYGILSIGGVIALTIGSLMLFEGISVSLVFLLPTLVVVGGGCCLIAFFGLKVQPVRSSVGTEILKDETGVVRQKLNPKGIVFIRGEYWTAESAGEILEEGSEVKVNDIKGLTLIVSKK